MNLVDSLKEELRLTRETNLAVVRNLQEKLNELERELEEVKKEAQADYASWMTERSVAQEMEDRHYNCGEL